MSPKSNYALVSVIIFAGAMIFLSGTIPYTTLPFSQWDLCNYRHIAHSAPHIDLSVCPPYTYRILGPYLVGLLPLPDAQGFYALSIALSLFLAIAYFSLLCQLGLSRTSAAMATILLTMNRYFFGFTVWDFFQINDLISELLLVLLFSCMLKGAWWKYGFFLLLGALTRETVFLIMPATVIYLWENKKIKSSIMHFVAAIVPGLAVFIILRMVLKSTCTLHEAGLPQSGAAYYFWAFAKYIGQFFQPETLFRRLINVFVPFSFLPIIFFGIIKTFVVNHKYLAVFYCLVFASTAFGGDAERLMAPTFIVFYFLIGSIIEKTIATKPLSFFVVAASAFISTLHHQNARFALPSQKVTIVLSMGSLCFMTALCVWYRIINRTTSTTRQRAP